MRLEVLCWFRDYLHLWLFGAIYWSVKTLARLIFPPPLLSLDLK